MIGSDTGPLHMAGRLKLVKLSDLKLAGNILADKPIHVLLVDSDDPL